jgi:hypothetical protein
MRAPSAVFAIFLGAGLAIVPMTVAGQRPYAWVMPSADQEETIVSPFSLLLDQSEVLELAASQTGRIESIREKLIELNEPLLAQIRDAELFPPESEEERVALQNVRDRFAANAKDAEQQVRELLSGEQREKALELIGHDSWAYPPEKEEDPAAEDVPEKAEELTTVVVENHNYLDATVYAVSGPRRQRLGFVGGLTTARFTLPESFVNSTSGMRFEVRQIPSYTLPLTDEVPVDTGYVVYVRIPPA